VVSRSHSEAFLTLLQVPVEVQLLLAAAGRLEGRAPGLQRIAGRRAGLLRHAQRYSAPVPPTGTSPGLRAGDAGPVGCSEPALPHRLLDHALPGTFPPAQFESISALRAATTPLLEVFIIYLDWPAPLREEGAGGLRLLVRGRENPRAIKNGEMEVATGISTPNSARADPRASATARKPWRSLRFQLGFLGMRNNHPGKQPPLSAGDSPGPVWRWPRCSASPVGPQPGPVLVTATGPTCSRAWGSVASLGGGPGGPVAPDSVLGAAPGGDSQPPSFFSSVLMVQFTMLPAPSSSRWGETGLLMDILRGDRAISRVMGHPPAMSTPFPSLAPHWGALCCWFSRGKGLAFCHSLEKLRSCSWLPELRLWQIWGSMARSPQRKKPFTPRHGV